MPYLTEAAGARIVVHDGGVMPFPESDGFSVAPNTLVDVSIHRVNVLLAVYMSVFHTTQVPDILIKWQFWYGRMSTLAFLDGMENV